MKKLSLLVALMSISYNIFAQSYSCVENGVSIEIEENCYIIDVQFPMIRMKEITLYSSIEERMFATADFGFNEGDNSPFYYSQQNGGPEIPFLSLNLQIPEGATVQTTIEEIEYGEEKVLNYPYVPVQNTLEELGDSLIQYNEELYSLYESVPAVTSSPFTYMGASGVNVKLFPFTYDFRNYRICPILRIRYIVCVTGSESLLAMYRSTIEQENLADAVEFYNTYCQDVYMHPNYKGNYLIITSPEYESEAEMYAHHKANLGYNAWVQIYNSDFADPTYIRHQLKANYDYEDMRPRYVLIIGNEETIPFSRGEDNNDNQPYTDIYYACLDNYDISLETYLTPDLYVGRWPVHNHQELQHIIEKSVNYDLLVPNDRRFALFTGTGDESYIKFVDASNYVSNVILQSETNCNYIHYNGADGFNSDDMIEEFANNDNLMLAYRGHGGTTAFGDPFSNVSRLNIPFNLPYFTFSIACNTGKPDGLGFSWMNLGDRSVSFYGATVPTYRNFNNALEKCIFNSLKYPKNHTIGEFTYRGVSEYFISGGSSLEVQSYVFYGDPSLYTFGMEFLGNPVQPVPAKKQDEILDSNHTPSIYNVFTPLGVLMQSGKIENLNSSIGALNKGFYVVTICDNNNIVIKSEKIFIK